MKRRKESSGALVPLTPAALVVPSGARLVEAFLSGRSERTTRAYRQDLQGFARFLGCKDADEAAQVLLSRGHGAANETALLYRAALVERGLSPATVNRRLAAVRSMVKLARTLGLVPWTLEVPAVKSQAYRDTRGPGRDGYRLMLDELDTRLDDKARRDRAAVRLLYDMALRRGEVVALDVEDVDLEAGTVSVMGKGRTEKELRTLPAPTAEALAAWLEVRGTDTGPLFINFDRAGKGKRLTGRSLYRVVQGLGEAVGLAVRPHGLRHAAITEALDLTKGDVRAVQKFSRHRNTQTLMIYDDNREDMAGEVAAMVAEAVKQGMSP